MESLDTAATVQAKDEEILSELGRIVRRPLPGCDDLPVRGAAKGIRNADPDPDVLIITNAHLRRPEEAPVTEAIGELELANGVVISTVFYSREDWDAPLTRVTPIRARVEAGAERHDRKLRLL